MPRPPLRQAARGCSAPEAAQKGVQSELPLGPATRNAAAGGAAGEPGEHATACAVAQDDSTTDPSADPAALHVDVGDDAIADRDSSLTAAHGRRMFQLASSLCLEQLRGVSTTTALSCFGRHWSGAVTGGYGRTQSADADFACSECVDVLDDFISHDWGTGRWWKFTCLIAIYNSEVAWAASVLVSLTLGVLRAAIAPDFPSYPRTADVGGVAYPTNSGGCPCQIAGAVVYIVVLLFWQRFRQVLGLSRRMMFVDKLCIHQTNAALKAEGIASLAGFLRHSSRLVVLWSPRYLQRLWCVYELASWVHLEKDIERTTVVVPVKFHACMFLVQWLFLVYYLTRSLANSLNVGINLVLFACACTAGILGPILHCLLQLLREVRRMPEQLAGFSIRESECYCCTRNHIHPLTGATLDCDRLLVNQTLARWFIDARERPSESKDAYLDRFDEYIRTTFRQNVLSRSTMVGLTYRRALIITAPAMWYAIDRIPSTVVIHNSGQSRAAARWAMGGFISALGMFPLITKIVWECAYCLAGVRGGTASCLGRAASTVALLIIVVCVAVVLYIPLELGLDRAGDLLHFLIMAGYGLLTLVIFSDRCRRWQCWVT